MVGVIYDAHFCPGAELADANSNFLEKVLDFVCGLWYTIGVKGR